VVSHVVIVNDHVSHDAIYGVMTFVVNGRIFVVSETIFVVIVMIFVVSVIVSCYYCSSLCPHLSLVIDHDHDHDEVRVNVCEVVNEPGIVCEVRLHQRRHHFHLLLRHSF